MVAREFGLLCRNIDKRRSAVIDRAVQRLYNSVSDDDVSIKKALYIPSRTCHSLWRIAKNESDRSKV